MWADSSTQKTRLWKGNLAEAEAFSVACVSNYVTTSLDPCHRKCELTAMITVLFGALGNIGHVQLPEGSVVNDLLRPQQRNSGSVFLNGKRVGLNIQLADGDQVLFAHGVRGAAPIPLGNKDLGTVQLTNFTAGAKELIITDPYFLNPGGRNVQRHAKWILETINLDSGTLQSVIVIGKETGGDWNVVFDLVSDAAASRACSVRRIKSDEIHDRLWIKDRSEAKAVGASLNGFGKRLAFILDLPKSDLSFLLRFLQAEFGI